MKLIWTDETFLNNKNTNYQLDSSRTTDSISNLINQEETFKAKEKDISNFSLSKFNKNDIQEEKLNLLKNLYDGKNEYCINHISFKKCLSMCLCIIYLILFLIYLPKSPKKIGSEQQIKDILKTYSNESINILVNNFNFLCYVNTTFNINSKDKINKEENNCELTGYILEFSINKVFIFRWIIGFIYFCIKCICFIYSNNKNNNNENQFDERKIIIIQKACMIIFPFILFFYDLKNKITFSQINFAHTYNNKLISFYIVKENNFSMIDYIEGIIPTLFVFLISFDYSSVEKIINNILVKKTNRRKFV